MHVAAESTRAPVGPRLDRRACHLRLAHPASHDDGLAELTARQREVLALMADGLSNAAIARRLVVTEKAVVQHCSNIYAALDLAPCPDDHRRVLAVLRHVADERTLNSWREPACPAR